MLKWNKSIILFVILLSQFALAQTCSFQINGELYDEISGQVIADAQVYLLEGQLQTKTDSAGRFQFDALCPGNYHIEITHINYQKKGVVQVVPQQEKLLILVESRSQIIDELIIHTDSEHAEYMNSNHLHVEPGSDKLDENLAGKLESLSGVSILKTGSGIGKPIIQGMVGNRVAIINNGIELAGQQWGNDHEPAIDANSAKRITVLTPVDGLAYTNTALGSLIHIESGAMPQDPHIHGNVSYLFSTNGLGHSLYTQLEQARNSLAWRIQATAKIIGDRKTPQYYLTNTGVQNQSFSMEIERKTNKKWTNKLSYRFFHNKNALLRGSHIGNINDLEEALNRTIPFYTKDKFSYQIDNPFQNVFHHFLQFNSQFQISAKRFLQFNYGSQMNSRKEFDVRRNGRGETPSLSLKRWDQNASLIWSQEFSKFGLIKAGIQGLIIDNTNQAETGILPLIPDYRSYQAGTFALWKKQVDRFSFGLGIRADYKYYLALTISQSLPREILRFEHHFRTLQSAGSSTYNFSQNASISYSLAYAERNPGMNELYSYGLHQGVSGIEEGNANLASEQAFKQTLATEIAIQDKLFISGNVFLQNITNYIYLQSQDEIRTTIRGAFPVFAYEQTDARLFGYFLQSNWIYLKNGLLELSYSYIKAQDLLQNLSIINIPSNEWKANGSYTLHNIKNMDEIQFSLDYKYVFRQKDILASQDFVLPPDSYALLGMGLSVDWKTSNTPIRSFLRIDNILNTTYRDYLNRQRYFADEMGRNIKLGISLKF